MNNRKTLAMVSYVGRQLVQVMRVVLRCLFVIGLLGLVYQARAETILFDDFITGHVPQDRDGIDVFWTGDTSEVDGSLILLPPDAVVTSVCCTSVKDASIQTQLHLMAGESGDAIGIAARTNFDPFQSYFAALNVDGLLSLFRTNTESPVAAAATGLNVASEDVILQMDVFGDTVALRAWPALGEMPRDAQLMFVDPEPLDAFPSRVGVFSNPLGSGAAQAQFRYFHVADHIIIGGDGTDDGLINIDDLNAVRNNFGSGDGSDKTGIPGDTLPYDGLVNIDDLNAVRNNFGAGVAAVPEPAAWALVTIGFALCGATPRRGHDSLAG